MATCENLYCLERFERVRPWQRFCSDHCRHRARAQALKRRVDGTKVLDQALIWFSAGGGFIEEARLRDACEAYQAKIREGEA